MAYQQNQSVKIVFIGNGGCGKTTYLNMLRTGNFERKYIPTMGVEVHPIRVDGVDDLTFNCWDCAGQERFGGLQEEYYKGAHTILVCFTQSSKLEVKSIPGWIKMARDTCPEVKIILLGMKSDLPAIPGLLPIIRQTNLPFCSISTKTRMNSDLPFRMIRESM